MKSDTERAMLFLSLIKSIDGIDDLTSLNLAIITGILMKKIIVDNPDVSSLTEEEQKIALENMFPVAKEKAIEHTKRIATVLTKLFTAEEIETFILIYTTPEMRKLAELSGVLSECLKESIAIMHTELVENLQQFVMLIKNQTNKTNENMN